MSLILLHFLAILPGVLICFLIVKMDKYEQEPLGAIFYCYFLGMLATIPVIFIQKWSGALYVFQEQSAALTFIASFAVVASSEELAKGLTTLLGAYPRRFFNEPVDGIVYSVLVGMGFATVENIIYATHFGMETTIVRAFTAVPAHLVFAIIQGYYLGLAKFHPGRRMDLLLRGLGISIFFHGLYDFLILQEMSEWLSLLGSVSVYLCLYYCGPLIREHLDNSPFRNSANP